MLEVILKQFEKPDAVRTFENGKFELVHIGGMTIARATYSPGWRWSEHVGRLWARNVATWNMWAWLSLGERLQSLMAVR